MTTSAVRPSLPRIASSAMAEMPLPPSSMRSSLDRGEDWSEIEALLESVDPMQDAARKQTKRHAPLLLASAAATSAAIASVLAVAFLTPWPNCALRTDGCTVPMAPVPARTETSAAPAPQANRVNDIGTASADTGVQQLILQGRSVSKIGVKPEQAPAESAAAAGDEMHRR